MSFSLAAVVRVTAHVVVLASALSASLTSKASQAAETRPNVILVMTDDQGYGDLACHGNTMIETPNLDRLYKQSLRLTDFHVDPTCSPTRSALMTGRYSSRTGVWHTIAGRSIMRRDETTMGQAFAANGYRTAIFGKWHLGDNYPSRPQDRGFHEVLIHGGGGVTQTPDLWDNDYFDDRYLRNGKVEQFEGYCTDVWFREAMQFIEQNKDRPFFCYMPTNAAHGPFLVADKYSEPYRRRGVPEAMANFYGMITNFDENIGRLMARLDELDLSDNTILIYMTDNGSAAGTTGGRARRGTSTDVDTAWPGFDAGMRGAKGSQYDGGHRVPCFIRWPEKIKADRDLDRLAAHIDLLPTLIGLCQLEPPHGVRFDGVDLSPLLVEKGDLPLRTLFVHSQRIEHPEKWKTSAVMSERWRLIDGRELFDVNLDPGQTADVAESYPAVVVELRAAYEDWWSDISTRFDEYCEIVIGHDAENPARITCHDWHSDDVPWSQPAVRQAPMANGFWAIEVAQPGRYEFTLRQEPVESKKPLDAARARIKVGDVEQSRDVPEGAVAVTMVLELPAGKTRLETWLARADGTARGAFFIEVRRL